MNLSLKNKILVALFFSIAMAFLESAVVIYLRFLLYPEGFSLPLKQMSQILIITELGRETATILMLVAVGYMLAHTKLSRFAWFLFCFAVWDIFYYVFLYVLLGWPGSLLDWDILFLIPVVWYGPVITPCLVAATLIGLALVIVAYEHKGAVRRFRKREWGTMAIGCGVILFTFMWPFLEYSANITGGTGMKELVKAGMQYIPTFYNWPLYFAGLATLWGAIWVYWRRVHNANQILY